MLRVENLNLHYGHSQILHGVSLEAEQGQITCVMGTNGVGKTSLMRAISGSHPRSGGEVTLDGRTLGVLPANALARLGVGYVPQGREIFPLLSVQENLETGFGCLPAADHRVPEEVFTLFQVLVEQYFDFAFDLADRFEVLQQGRVVLSGARGAIPREKLLASVSV